MKIQIYKILFVVFAISWLPTAYATNGTVLHTPYTTESVVMGDEDGNLVANISGSGQWDINFYRNEIVLIPMDGVLIPIEIEKRALTADHESGSFVFQDGALISATSTPVDSFELPPEYTFEYRPTLYISISGFQPAIEKIAIDPWVVVNPNLGVSIDGVQWSDWQDIFNANLQEEFANGQKYQYKHFLVHWDNQKSQRKQGAALANKIKRFLKERREIWDVVLVGHSRGALMVNRLSKYLVGHEKIDNLHSYLLDPTASPQLGDQYPSSLPSKSPTNSFGTVYYDRNGVISATYGGEVIFSTDLGTTSDRDILGYDTVRMEDSTHETIHTDWMDASQNGLAQAFLTIQSKKVKGEFAPDGTLGLDIVQVSVTKGVDIWGEAECSSGGCSAQGEITVDGFSVAYAEGSVDGSGVAVSYGVVSVIAGQYVIKRDQILVVQTVGIPKSPLNATITAGMDKRGISAGVTFFGAKLGAGISTSELIAIDVQVFGLDIEGNLNEDVIDVGYNEVIKPLDPTGFSCSKCPSFSL